MKSIKIKVVVEKKVTYCIHKDLLENYNSEQELAEEIVDNLGLVDGEIEFENDSFSINGERVNGLTIEVYQEGEYNMYGGPYTPKMSKPIIKVDGLDVFDQVKEAFDNYGWGDDMIDISRTDIWGYII